MVEAATLPPKHASYDVVIVGGAIMGSSAAYWLTANPDFRGRVLVVEKDYSYRFAATSLAASCIRQQYSQPVNVLISQFGVEFIRSFRDRMQKFYDRDVAPDLAFKEHGFLYCCKPEQAEAAKARAEMQRELGAFSQFLSPGEILQKFPFINVEDLGGATWASEAEGWFDNFGLLNGLRHAARKQGAEYIENEVIAVQRAGDRIVGVKLKSGEEIACGELVNASGTRGRIVANMAGLDIPIEARKRDIFVFSAARPVEGRMPHLVDISGTFCRPESEFYLTGDAPADDPEVALDDFEGRHEDFENHIWPNLARRIPQFEAIKLRRFWTGHYDFNLLDYNAIVGRHIEVKNFVFVNGFSGHGLQQAPAVGRGVSELLVYGDYRTLDLSPLGYERVQAGVPLLEAAII